MRRDKHGRFVTSTRALDGHYIPLVSWRNSSSAFIGITGQGSTYISAAGLRQLRRAIDRHLRAMKGKP